MEFERASEQVMLAEAVGAVAAEFGHPYFAKCTAEGTRPDALWEALGTQGFLGVHLPVAHGGGGAGIAELAIVGEEVAAQGCPLLLTLVSPAICAELIARYGTESQQSTWLPSLGAGAKMAFAITEPDAGSNSHNLSTVATRDGGEWRISGAKTYISGVDEADQILLVTRTSTDPDTGRGRLTLFIVDSDAPGLTRQLIPTETKIPEKQFQLFFDGVVVADDRRIGDVDDGLRVVFDGLNPERIMSAALLNGVSRYVLDIACRYASERVVWGTTPVGAHQGVAHPLATAKIELELARLMNDKAAWLHDHSEDRRAAGEAANMAKFAAAEAAAHCLDASIQAMGGNGMASDYGVADLWGIVRLLKIAPVSREMILNFISTATLGLPRSY